MEMAARPPRSIRFRGRSFMAMVLAPEPPVAEWLQGLDDLLRRSPGFFNGRSVVLDVQGLPQLKADLTELIAELHARGIRILGIEGADPAQLSLGMPPAITGGRSADMHIPYGQTEPIGKQPAKPAAQPAKREPSSLLVDEPVRSGQSIVFPEGDVTVVGSVASGAEIIAGGSIHVYGALRGRAVAGSASDPNARIYCRKFDPELIGINGLYNTADTVDARFRGKPIQARLNGSAIVLSAMD